MPTSQVSQTFVFAAIDTANRTCTMVTDVVDDWVLKALDDGLMIVPVSPETARVIWLQGVPDVYAAAYQRRMLPAPAPADGGAA